MEKGDPKETPSSSSGKKRKDLKLETEENLSDESGRATGTPRRSSGSTTRRSSGSTPRRSSESTPQKSSGSTPQRSDSTSGVDVKYDTTCVPDLQIESLPSTSVVTVIEVSPKKSPKKSPIKAVREGVREGIRRIRRSLSPKEPGSSRERSVSPTAGTSSDQSPQNTGKKSYFRKKSKSPRRREKRCSDQTAPLLLGDELRHSSEEDQTSPEKSPSKNLGAIPKTYRQKLKAKVSPKRSTYERMDVTEDDSPSDKVPESRKEKLKKKFKILPLKRTRHAKEQKKDDVEEELGEPGPLSHWVVSQDEIGVWSDTRITPDEKDYTAPASEVDLDSMSSYTFAEFPDHFPDDTELEVSSTREQMSQRLGLEDPEEASRGASIILSHSLKVERLEDNVTEMTDVSETPSFAKVRRTHGKRQVQSETPEHSRSSDTRNLPDPGPSPKKLPKVDEGIDGKSHEKEESDEETESDSETKPKDDK